MRHFTILIIFMTWVFSSGHVESKFVPQLFDGLNGKEMDIKIKGNKVKVQSYFRNETYKKSKTLNITIQKTFWSRGFYVNQPYFSKSNVTISLKFYRYNGELVKVYDEDHEYDPKTGFASNYVRGVNKLVITFPESQVARDDEIQIFEEPWIMNQKFQSYFGMIILLYTSYTLLKMKDANWIFVKRTHFNDDDYVQQPESPVSPVKRQKKCCACFGDLSLKWKLNLQYAVIAMFHMLDVYTDFVYIFTVHMYSMWFAVAMYISIIGPILFILYAYDPNGSIRSRFVFFLLCFTGTLNHWLINVDGLMVPEILEGCQSAVHFAFLFEDGPQFILQMLNSLMVGGSWKWIQIISPFMSLKALSGRFIVEKHEFGNPKVIFGCQFLLFVLPAVILVLCFFNWSDTRPEWAKLHSTVRLNLGNVTRPVIY